MTPLLRGLFSGQPRLVGMCRELYVHRQWLWTFLEQEVEPTNNASERALRHAVIWRKLCFGTQSAGGSRFVETMLTVMETCRQQSGTCSPTSRQPSKRTSLTSQGSLYSPELKRSAQSPRYFCATAPGLHGVA